MTEREAELEKQLERANRRIAELEEHSEIDADILKDEREMADYIDAGRLKHIAALEHKIYILQEQLSTYASPQLYRLDNVLQAWAIRTAGSDRALLDYKKLQAQMIWEFVKAYYAGRNELF